MNAKNPYSVSACLIKSALLSMSVFNAKFTKSE